MFAPSPLVGPLHRHHDGVLNSPECIPASPAEAHRKTASRSPFGGDHMREEPHIDLILLEVCDCKALVQAAVREVGGEELVGYGNRTSWVPLKTPWLIQIAWSIMYPIWQCNISV